MTIVDFYDKGQIDAKEIGAPDDAASSSGSLWARVKNAVARIINLETADSNNVKKTGTSTVTGNLQVPTTPPSPTSAVNSAYTNDATEGVNNIVHKTGNEKIGGVKTFSGDIVKSSTADITSAATAYVNMASINIVDVNNVNAAQIRRDRLAGNIDRLYLTLNKPVGSDTYGLRFDLTINGSGECTLSVNKLKNGSTVSSQQLWSA